MQGDLPEGKIVDSMTMEHFLENALGLIFIALPIVVTTAIASAFSRKCSAVARVVTPEA
jgi:hypothetical protein